MNILEIVNAVKKTFQIDEIDNVHVIEKIAEDRAGIYRNVFEHPEEIGQIGALTGTVDGVEREFVYGIANSEEIEVPCVSCQVTFEDMSLSECVEYCFADEQPYPLWHVAKVSIIAIEDFKAKKFKLWEHQLKAPECEAAFRRLLQQGPIRHVYDKFIFPTPDSLAINYKVIDDHSGKSVDIPHQVDRMRIWNHKTGQYEPFDPSLVGAPRTEEEARMYWSKLIEELRELRGKEYIDSLMGV